MFEDPLAGDHICTGRPRKKILSVVGEKSRKLGLHGCPPIWISEGSTVGARNWRQLGSLKDGGHLNATFPASPHGMLVLDGRHGNDSSR
jgi:hypothetical protein